MPTDLYRNDQVYNMVAEGEIAQLLSRFSGSYIMDVIDSHLRNRYAFNPAVSNPNIVSSFELNFKDMMSRFPTDADNIVSVRYETYLAIINKICSEFNLQYIGNEPDCFSLAYNLYDFLVSGYSRNIINFFASYIFANREQLYSAMGLERFRKNKDSGNNYVKKVYNDPVVAVIIARIKDVVYYISGFDISIYSILSFNYNRDTADFIFQNIQPLGNIFKDEFCKVVDNPAILTEIRVAIQRMLEMKIAQEQQIAEMNAANKNIDNQEEGDEQ
jgi:hypothetical protein